MSARIAALALVLLAACGPFDATAGSARCAAVDAWLDASCGPVITNLEPDETLRYSLALLVGEVDDGDDAAATLTVTGVDGATDWPVVERRFKALVRLSPGDNELTLASGDAERHVTLRYEPQTNPRFVRLVWIRAADGDGSFDAPPDEPHDEASALERLRTAALLMQTFTAESLHRMGFGRRTFRLESDAGGRPEVEVFRSELTMAEAHAMNGNALWSHFYEALSELPARDDSIDVALMSMTRYDPVSRQALAHTALGGGRLGLFGSGALHTWAARPDEIVERWSDARAIDTTTLLDDSAFRGRYWSNFATGLGATLHELGHCLSLPHPASGVGIMSREFDHINRLFMLTEPESDTTPEPPPIEPDDEKLWDPSHATRLRYHRWLALDDVAYASDDAPQMHVAGGALQIESANGLRHVEYRVIGDSVDFDAFAEEPPHALERPIPNLRARLPGATSALVSAIDDAGNIAEAIVELGP